MNANPQKLKTIVVTGGATGIGLETVRSLASTGKYHVVVICLNRTQMELAAKELQDQRVRLSFFTCDLSDPEQIRLTVKKIASTQKCIYGVVNNAGIYPFGGIEKTTVQIWDMTMNVNLRATFLMTQALLPLMKENGVGAGRVVNISSTAGILPNQHALAYSVSKAAVIQFTKTVAKEVGQFGVTANVICPGIVRSPMHETYHQTESELEDFYYRRGAAFPMGRVGEAKDIVGAIQFLLSDDASWMTGDVLVIDGGRLLQ